MVLDSPRGTKGLHPVAICAFDTFPIPAYDNVLIYQAKLCQQWQYRVYQANKKKAISTACEIALGDFTFGKRTAIST